MKQKCTYLNNLKQQAGVPYMNPNKDNPLQNEMLKTERVNLSTVINENKNDATIMNKSVWSNLSKRFQKYKKRSKQKEQEYKKKLASIYNNDIVASLKKINLKNQRKSNIVTAIKPVVKFEYDKIFEEIEEKIFNNEQMSIDQSWIQKDQNEMTQETEHHVYAEWNKSNTISEITIRKKKRIISATTRSNQIYY